jgi:zinc protease
MAEVERDAEIYRAGKIRNLYQSMSLQGKARLNGLDVYVVEGKPDKGPTEKLFFDADNGLLLRWDMVRRNPQRGNIFVKVHLDDYRDVDGVKVPFKVRFAFESFNLTLKIDALKHNVPIDDAVFEKPRT